MRYTARARMLSWDFPSDAAVQSLPAEHALALAFMIARADNLGRLPGEPEVLLSHLFTPRKPRADFSADMLTECLWALVSLGIVCWYENGGIRFVELTKWSGHQTIRAELRKSDFPSPAESVVLQCERRPPEEVATSARQSSDFGATSARLCRDFVAPEVEGEVEGEAEPRLSFASLKKVDLLTCKKDCGEMWTNSKDALGTSNEGKDVSEVMPAEKVATASPQGPRPHVELVHDALKSRGATTAELAVALGITGKLFREGLQNPTCLRMISEWWYERRAAVKNPWAYLNTKGGAWDRIVSGFSAKATVEDHREQERLTREWLDGLSTPKNDA